MLRRGLREWCSGPPALPALAFEDCLDPSLGLGLTSPGACGHTRSSSLRMVRCTPRSAGSHRPSISLCSAQTQVLSPAPTEFELWTTGPDQAPSPTLCHIWRSLCQEGPQPLEIHEPVLSPTGLHLHWRSASWGCTVPTLPSHHPLCNIFLYFIIFFYVLVPTPPLKRLCTRQSRAQALWLGPGHIPGQPPRVNPGG